MNKSKCMQEWHCSRSNGNKF